MPFSSAIILDNELELVSDNLSSSKGIMSSDFKLSEHGFSLSITVGCSLLTNGSITPSIPNLH